MRPSTKEENYRLCENIWKEKEMASLKAYLMWYNNAIDNASFALIDKANEDLFHNITSVKNVTKMLLCYII